MTTIEKLENWVQGHKGRYVHNIEIDDGYGATCWSVILGNVDVKPGHDWYKEQKKRAEVFVSETNFFEMNKCPPNVAVVIEGNSMEYWPGLEATILLAIKKAEELGL